MYIRGLNLFHTDFYKKKNKEKPGEKNPTQPDKNGHNWPTHMLRRSGIEPSTFGCRVRSVVM
jgi:hypothetical protein